MLETEIKKLTAAVEALTVAIGKTAIQLTASEDVDQTKVLVEKPLDIETSEPPAAEAPAPSPGGLSIPGSTGKPIEPLAQTQQTLPFEPPAPQGMEMTNAKIGNTPIEEFRGFKNMPPGMQEPTELQTYAVKRVAEISRTLGNPQIMMDLMGNFGIVNVMEADDEILRKFINEAENTLQGMTQQGA